MGLASSCSTCDRRSSEHVANDKDSLVRPRHSHEEILRHPGPQERKQTPSSPSGLALEKWHSNGQASPKGEVVERRPGARRTGGASGTGSRQFDKRASGPSEEETLAACRRPRRMGQGTRELVKGAMKQDRACALLEDDKIDTVLQTMEFFEFKAGEHVVKQGKVGSTFFVVHEGRLSVTVNGNPTNTLSRGMAFGGLALLYQCPRTASVIATASSTCCWGASGNALSKVLQENSQRQASENRKFLDSMQLFQGLSSKQKDVIAETVVLESFEAGSRVATEGEAAAAIYGAKLGDFRVFKGGKVSASGELVGGQETARLKHGECFGDQELINQTTYSATVVAASQCQTLCIALRSLKEALGEDLRSSLERAILLSGVRKSSVLSQFSAQQQDSLVSAMQLNTFGAGEGIEGFRFFVVLEGTVKGPEGELGRGQIFEEDIDEARSSPAPSPRASTRRTAGPGGCRLGALGRDGIAQALQTAGLSASGSVAATSAEDFARRLMVIRKVHVFRHLSNEQVDMLAKAFVCHKYHQGQMVFKQGDMGAAFFVIAQGEVTVSIDDKFIRTMGKNAYFGERALLFEEKRSASIEVTSKTADLWSVEKSIFSQIVEGKMQQQLMERIKLQDTSASLKDLKHVTVIGAGAAGVVRLVQHKQTGMRYALKRVKKKRGKIPEEVERECKLLSENDHPFVMHLVKTFETPRSVYMLTELITGGELHAAIRTIPTVLSRTQAQFYAGSLVLVLEELAGRNIVYRDLKPENVMLDAQGYLKLVDFGIAKKLAEGKTQTFTVIGTPHYMAPEVLQCRGYGVEADIWSLGVLLYEFVVGSLPFADDLDNPTEVCQEVLKASLQFPAHYKDTSGKTLMQGMLRRQPRKRQGAGINGYEDLKSAEFFQLGHKTTSVFEKIVGRKLDPPVVPAAEKYADPEDLSEVTLSDAGELG